MIAHRKKSHGKLLVSIEGDTDPVSGPSGPEFRGHKKSDSSFDGLYEPEEKSPRDSDLLDSSTSGVHHHWGRVRGLIKPSKEQIDDEGVGNQKDSLGQISMDTNHDGSADMVLVDVNGDGNIDTIGLDTNGDGKIDTYRKWNTAVPDAQPGSLAAILRKKKSKQTLAQQRKIALTDLFYVIDKQGDGNIEEDELSEFLENVRVHP